MAISAAQIRFHANNSSIKALFIIIPRTVVVANPGLKFSKSYPCFTENCAQIQTIPGKDIRVGSQVIRYHTFDGDIGRPY